MALREYTRSPDESVLYSVTVMADGFSTASRIGFFRSFSTAARYLLPIGDHRTVSSDTASVAAGVKWFLPLGLIIGLIWAGVFRVSWRMFGEIANLRAIPALTVTTFECLLTGPYLVMGLARTIHLLAGQRPRLSVEDPMAPLSPVGTLVLCLAILAHWVLIVSIPDITTWWPADMDWRHYFNFMYPRAILRPLILAPLWGRWGILLAASIGRMTPQADEATTALGRAITPARLLLFTLLPLALTAIYCSRDRNRFIGVIIALIVFALTYMVSFAMARRGGGQTRQSIFAAGLTAQLVFLAAYRAFWPKIHG